MPFFSPPSYPFPILSRNPPKFSPAFISYAQNADRQCSGLVVYSVQSYTVTGCINFPESYQTGHTSPTSILSLPTPWLSPFLPAPPYNRPGSRRSLVPRPTPITALACRYPSHSLRWGPWAPPGPHLASHPYPAHPASNKTQARPQGLQRVAPHQGIMTHPLSPWEKRNKWVNRTGDFPLNWPHFQVFLQRF